MINEENENQEEKVLLGNRKEVVVEEVEERVEVVTKEVRLRWKDYRGS